MHFLGAILEYTYSNKITITEKKERAKMALLESNFENRLSFVEESRFFFLNNHVWRKNGEPNWTFFFALKRLSKLKLHR